MAEWREEIYKKCNPLFDSVRISSNAEDSLVAAQAIMNEWEKNLPLTSMFPNGPHIGPAAVEWKFGFCREYTDGVVYLLRALGIPAGIDRTI